MLDFGELNESRVPQTFIVTGGRDYDNASAVKNALEQHVRSGDILIHGAATGADTLAHEIGIRIPGLTVLPIPAWWAKYNKSAGHIRNSQMLDIARLIGCEVTVIAFPGGSGTAGMVKLAKGKGVLVVEVEEEVKA